MKGIDRFGSLARFHDKRIAKCCTEFQSEDFVDLTGISAPMIPSLSPDGRHEFIGRDGSLQSTDHPHRVAFFASVAEVESELNSEGAHRVLFCLRTSAGYRMAYWSFRTGPAYRRSVLRPRPWVHWLEPKPDLARFPHLCPTCGSAAYVGLNLIECTGERCRGR